MYSSTLSAQCPSTLALCAQPHVFDSGFRRRQRNEFKAVVYLGSDPTHATHSENEHQCIKNKDRSKSTNKLSARKDNTEQKKSSTIYNNHNNNNPLRPESFVISSLNLHDHLPPHRRYSVFPLKLKLRMLKLLLGRLALTEEDIRCEDFASSV